MSFRARILPTPWLSLIKAAQLGALLRSLELDTGNTLLDVGCSSGRQFIHIARRTAYAVGIDHNHLSLRSAAMLAQASALKGVGFYRCDATRLPFRDNVFDRVLLSDILSIVDDPRQVLREALRVLSDDGRLIIVNGRGYRTIRRFYESTSISVVVLRTVLCRMTALPRSVIAFYGGSITKGYAALSNQIDVRYKDIDGFLERTIADAGGVHVAKRYTFNGMNEFVLAVLTLLARSVKIPFRLFNYLIAPLTPLFILSEKLFPARNDGLSVVFVVSRIR